MSHHYLWIPIGEASRRIHQHRWKSTRQDVRQAELGYQPLTRCGVHGTAQNLERRTIGCALRICFLPISRYCSALMCCEVLLATLPPLQSQFIIVEASAGNMRTLALPFFGSCPLQRFLHLRPGPRTSEVSPKGGTNSAGCYVGRVLRMILLSMMEHLLCIFAAKAADRVLRQTMSLTAAC